MQFLTDYATGTHISIIIIINFIVKVTFNCIHQMGDCDFNLQMSNLMRVLKGTYFMFAHLIAWQKMTHKR